MSKTYRNPKYRSEISMKDSKLTKTDVNRNERRRTRQSLNLDVTLHNDYTDRFEADRRNWDRMAPNFRDVSVPVFFLGV